MKLIIGIGNPGKRYFKNRHNVGYMVVESLRFAVDSDAKWKESEKGKLKYVWMRLGGKKVELLKPQTTMNDSGNSVGYVLKKHRDLKLTNIYVVHDDLDIKLGEYKIQLGKGPKDHKGIESINQALGTMDYWRVRVGVENRSTVDSLRSTANEKRVSGEPSFATHFAKTSRVEKAMEGKRYVLQNFTDEEMSVIDGVIDDIVEDLRVRMLD